MNKIWNDTFKAKLPKYIFDKFKPLLIKNQHELEQMLFNVKHGYEVSAFSDVILEFVDDIIQINDTNKENKDEHAYFEDEFNSNNL